MRSLMRAASVLLAVAAVAGMHWWQLAAAAATEYDSLSAKQQEEEEQAWRVVERGFFDGRPFSAQGSFLSRLLLQLLLILGTPRILHYCLLQHLWQPRVVSEILSGVILGPSVMGQIPGWMDTVFPAFSIQILGTVASLGLVLFLYMVGLGINSGLIETEWRFVFSCVGLSAALSMLFAPPLTLLFWTPDAPPSGNDYTRGTFPEMMLFVAVLQGITATGVLARIMAERGILAKRLGGVVMATTAVNLMYQAYMVAVALAMFGMSWTWTPPTPRPIGLDSPLDAATDLDPLWMLLCYLAYLLVLRFPLRWLFTRLALRAERKQKLDMFIVWLSLFCVFACGYFTQTLTLAGRLGGLTFALFAIPRHGTFPQDLRRHVEGLVMLVFMPIFYTWSGLRIDLSIVDGSDVWRIIILMVCGYRTKFSAIYMGACANGMHGFKGAYFGILHATKGFAAMVICNTVFDVGLITRRMLTIAIAFSIVTTILVTPLIRGLQLFETWFKARYRPAAPARPVSAAALSYNLLLIPSVVAAVEPLLKLVTALHPDGRYCGRRLQPTALRIVNSAEMDDSFAAMYLETATESELQRLDPVLGACAATWPVDFPSHLQLAAITAPEQLADTIGYIYGQGFTGDSLQEDGHVSTAYHTVAVDYLPALSPLVARLVSDRRVALHLLVGHCSSAAWSDYRHVLLLLGSSPLERRSNPAATRLAQQLLARNPAATISIWQSDGIDQHGENDTDSDDNPLNQLSNQTAVQRPAFIGDLPTVLHTVAFTAPPVYDVVVAPCFFDEQSTQPLDLIQNWIRSQAELSIHALDELYFSNVPILLVASPDPLYDVAVMPPDLGQDVEVDLAPESEHIDIYTMSGKMIDG